MKKNLNALLINGSPRKHGNTYQLLKLAEKELNKNHIKTKIIQLADHKINPCTSCRTCIKTGKCSIKDDMEKITPQLLNSHIIIFGSPVYFNNVSGQLKILMDRTWCLKGKLKNKIGGAIVVGRKYGHQTAINAIHTFFLKHEIIIGTRAVSALGYHEGEALKDKESLNRIKKLTKRLIELAEIVNRQTINKPANKT